MPLYQQSSWTWAETLNAVGETDASLRRKLQRGLVKINSNDAGRTDATLWDIARLRIARQFGEIGFEAKHAFGIAQVAVKKAFPGERFGAPRLIYFVSKRTPAGPAGPHVVTIETDDSQSGMRELALQVSDPSNAIVPVHELLSDAWYSLPGLPLEASEWLRKCNAQAAALFGKKAGGE